LKKNNPDLRLKLIDDEIDVDKFIVMNEGDLESDE
jgi:hypothetical protein